MPSQPRTTQSLHPVKATIRTLFQATFALVLKPGADPDDPDAWGIREIAAGVDESFVDGLPPLSP